MGMKWAVNYITCQLIPITLRIRAICKLGLSAPATADRVHKLEEAGVIKGYSAIMNW